MEIRDNGEDGVFRSLIRLNKNDKWVVITTFHVLITHRHLSGRRRDTNIVLHGGFSRRAQVLR